jgi:hypothetical protein
MIVEQSMSTKNLAMIVLAATLASGCATMKYGKTQGVEFDAIPTGTTVRVQPGSDAPLSTPATVLLSRKHDYKAYFEKPGYESKTVELKSESSGAMWRNLAWLHPIIWIPGLIIDASTGAGREFDPGKIMVTLTPLHPQHGDERPEAVTAPAQGQSFGSPSAPRRDGKAE